MTQFFGVCGFMGKTEEWRRFPSVVSLCDWLDIIPVNGEMRVPYIVGDFPYGSHQEELKELMKYAPFNFYEDNLLVLQSVPDGCTQQLSAVGMQKGKLMSHYNVVQVIRGDVGMETFYNMSAWLQVASKLPRLARWELQERMSGNFYQFIQFFNPNVVQTPLLFQFFDRTILLRGLQFEEIFKVSYSLFKGKFPELFR